MRDLSSLKNARFGRGYLHFEFRRGLETMSNFENLTNWEQLQTLLKKRERQQGRRSVDEAELQAHLKSRVKGQDAVIDNVARLLRLQMGKQQRSRPICNLLFLGPTGTG